MAGEGRSIFPSEGDSRRPSEFRLPAGKTLPNPACVEPRSTVGSREGVPHLSARRLPRRIGLRSLPMFIGGMRTMRRTLLGLGIAAASAVGAFDLGAGRAEAQVPGGSVVYETVAPGYSTVTY